MITIPRRKQKIKYSRKFACKHLEPLGDFSNSLQPLCVCHERDLVLGRRAYVCQVCSLYSQTNKKTPEVYDESKRVAEQKIKDKQIELDELELEEIKPEEEIDLTIDEFEEEDEEIPLKFEKRKVGKDELGADEFGEIECPFCGEIFENLESHIQTCELAPDDATPDDFLPKKRRKKKSKASGSEPESKDKEKCPYCGKEFIRLGRHLKSCPKRPKDEDEDDEEEEDDED